jgi:hypothetical protein
MESKSGNRNSDHQQGHGRLAALPNSGPTASVPIVKNTGVTEPLYRSSQKYVQFFFHRSCFSEIMETCDITLKLFVLLEKRTPVPRALSTLL